MRRLDRAPVVRGSPPVAGAPRQTADNIESDQYGAVSAAFRALAGAVLVCTAL